MKPPEAFNVPTRTYDFEGTLIAAPNLTKMPDIDRDEYGLAKVHIREYLGYVCVCPGDGPPSFEEDVMSALSTIDGSEGLDLIPSVSAESGEDVKASAELPCKPTRL